MCTPWQRWIFDRLAMVLALALPLATRVAPGDISRVSLANYGMEGDGESVFPVISADGRFIAFESEAANLVSGDTNGVSDIFWHDTQTKITIRVSLASDGTEADDVSQAPAISADGRYVAFHSNATNLVGGDTNGVNDIYVHDTQMGITTRLSITSGGTQGDNNSFTPAISADGRYVTFESNASNLVSGDTNNARDIFLHDTQTGMTSRVSLDSSGVQGDLDSYSPSISADGRYVAFHSSATNLVSGDTNGGYDVFLHDTQTEATSRLSVASDGTQANGNSSTCAISADGRYVAFHSNATNLVSGDTNGTSDVFVHDIQTGVTSRVSLASEGTEGNGVSSFPVLSADGRYVAFHSSASNLVGGDANGVADVFLRDTQTGTTDRVSLASDGAEGDYSSNNAAISADGRYVVFHADATNLVDDDTNGVADVFLRDIQTAITRRASLVTFGMEGNSESRDPAISADGRYVAFQSYSTNLVSGDTNNALDIFLRDTRTGATTRLSVASDGTQGDSHSFNPVISTDGRYTVFASQASNLVSGDTNNFQDIFLRDIQAGTTQRVSLAFDGSEGNGASSKPAISADGRYVAFHSVATNLVNGDTNGTFDVFVRDIQAGTTQRVSLAFDGAEADAMSYSPTISADGCLVAFDSYASNLVSGDTNGTYDIFLRDMQAGTTIRVSLAFDGAEGNASSVAPAISADGRYVAFLSYADNLVSGDTNGEADVFLRDTQMGTTTRLSVSSDGIEGNGSSETLAISANGRYVAFVSQATNLVSGDSNTAMDVFVHDTRTAITRRVSLASDGTEGNAESHFTSISWDGRYVAFDSDATNLVEADTNGFSDIFIKTIWMDIYLPMVFRTAP